MKKLLALVLAMVMTLGVATVGANAKTTEYKDAKDINYTEAVEVMSEIGVLNGDEDGFRPGDEMKRSEAAKIITYLLIGKASADQLVGGNKFTDVPASHWAAGYIEYLTVQGIVGGYGDGRFGPDDPLTTGAFCKMLIGALGYDATIEGMTGGDWMINVQKLAKQNKLFDKNEGAVVSANIKREEAALYAFNMICSPLVEYDNKGSTMTVNGATINFGAGKATYKVNSGKKQNRYSQIDNITSNNTSIAGTEYDIIEFGEEYFEKLVRNDGAGKDKGEDAFGRPENKWVYDGKKINSYPVDADLLYTKTVELGEIYDKLGLTNDTWVALEKHNASMAAYADDSLYFVNGQKQTITNGVGPIQIVKESTTKIGGSGTETYVYYNEGEIRICCRDWFVGDVVGVHGKTTTKAAYIDVTGRTGDSSTETPPVSGTKETEGYKIDDVVIYTAKLKNDGTYEIKDLQAAEVVKAQLNGFEEYGTEGLNKAATGNVTLGGKKYVYSARVAGTPDGSFIKKNVELEIVLDKYGYAIDVGDYGVQNYAVVINSGIAGDFNKDPVVNLLFTDGTTSGRVVVDGAGKVAGVDYPFYATTPANTDGIMKGDIVKYTTKSNGDYKLTHVGESWTLDEAGAGLANALEVVSNGHNQIDFTNAESTQEIVDFVAAGTRTTWAQAGNNHRVNGKTVFLIKDKNGNYKAYEGQKAVPTIEVSRGPVIISAALDGNANKVVYIDIKDAGLAKLKNNETVFVHFDRSHNRHTDAGGDTYYEVEAVVNGVLTTEDKPLKIDDEAFTDALELIYGAGTTKESFDRDYYVLYDSITYNSYGVASMTLGAEPIGNGLNRYAFVGSGGVTKGSLGIGTQQYIGAFDTRLNTAGGDFDPSKIESFTLANDVKAFEITKDNKIVGSSASAAYDVTKKGALMTYVWVSFNSDNEVNYLFWSNSTDAVVPMQSVAGGVVGIGALKGFSPKAGANASKKTLTVEEARLSADLQSALDIYDAVTITDVPVSGFSIPANIVIESGKTLMIDGNANISKRNYDGASGPGSDSKWDSLQVEGELVVDKTLTIDGYVTLSKDGLIRANTINVTENGDLTPISISATVQTTGGGMNVAGQSVHIMGKGGKLDISGPVVITGSFTIDVDPDGVALVSFDSPVYVAGDADVVLNGGEITFDSSLVILDGVVVISADANVDIATLEMADGTELKVEDDAVVTINTIEVEDNATTQPKLTNNSSVPVDVKAGLDDVVTSGDFVDENDAVIKVTIGFKPTVGTLKTTADKAFEALKDKDDVLSVSGAKSAKLTGYNVVASGRDAKDAAYVISGDTTTLTIIVTGRSANLPFATSQYVMTDGYSVSRVTPGDSDKEVVLSVTYTANNY